MIKEECVFYQQEKGHGWDDCANKKNPTHDFVFSCLYEGDVTKCPFMKN
jgi:hypothetical protein